MIGNLCFYFNEIRDHLQYCIEKDGFDQYQLADSIKQKIEEYWTILDDATTIASIIDPGIKTSLFELGEPTTNAINTLKTQFSSYLIQRPQPQVFLSKENSTSSREYFRQLKKRRLGVTANEE
jgi:hypothetical protein